MIRISRLDLQRWGHFEERSLRFGPSGRLHIVYGDNEAGKSTTRRAVSALLFGIPARTVDRRGRAYGDLRVGAVLELDGTPVELVRRKGNKDTVLDTAGAPIDEAPLTRALGGLTEEVHQGLFEVTHASLVEGGEELLEGRGAVGESLFAAAAGTTRLHRLLRSLEDEADAIFTPRGTKKELNAELRAYADAAKALKDAGLRPPEHDRLAAQLETLEAAAGNAGGELLEVEREAGRLERLRGAVPLVARRDTFSAELAGLGDVPPLAPDATVRREAATARRDAALVKARTARAAIARSRPRLDGLVVDEPLLARADEILELHGRARGVRESAEVRAQLVAELADDEAELTALLRALAPALGDRALDALSLDDAARERLDRCLEVRAGAEQSATAAQEAVNEAQRRAEAAARTLDAAPAVPDDAGLLAALRAARAVAGSEQTAASAMAEERAALTRAEQEAARLGIRVDADAAPQGAGEPGTTSRAATLAALPVPGTETIEALLATHAELAAAAQRLRDDEQRLAVEREELTAQRAALTGAEPLPDAAVLPAARAQRDAKWAEVRAALAAPLHDPEPLAAAFEAALAGADALADQRLQRADDLARVAAVDQRIAELDGQDAALAGRRARHARKAATATDDWAAAWAAVGEASPAPVDAASWLAARAAVLEHLAEAIDADRRAEAAQHETARHRTALSAALEAVGATVASTTTLTGLIEQADAQAELLRNGRDARERLADAARASADAHETARAAADRAERDLAAWRASWESLRDDCGLDAALSPDDALGALRNLAKATALQDRVGQLTRQIATIDARASQLADDVAALCAAVAPDLTLPGDPASDGDRPSDGATAADPLRIAQRAAAAQAVVGTLQQRVAAGQAAQQERTTIREALAGDEEALRVAEDEARVAEDDLVALRAAAGAQDDAELAQVEVRSARAATLRSELASLDADIASAGGASLDAVLAAVAALDVDALPAQVDDLDVRREALRARRDDAREELTRARDELARMERSDEAAQAAQAVASRLAKVQVLAERYARARLAQRVLRDAVERYRREHEGPMLERANELFPALTCERFARLVTELDERDQWVLVAIAGDGARLRVEELSDGTREQLFLALRLAAIERYVTAAGPIPVVFDDVLLESDDARAERVLAVLGDLARQTQVIVLTHHRHLVDLAEMVLPANRLDLIELGGTSPAGDAIEIGEPGEPDHLVPDRTPLVAPTLADELAAVAGDGPPPAPGEQSSLL
jgi:uncharacterized protein YhaN